MIYATSHGIVSIPFLKSMVGSEVIGYSFFSKHRVARAVTGWGRKKNAEKARRLAADLKLPYFSLEDGFLRSFYPGSCCPPLSIVLDDVGIYYDCTCPSFLEQLLNSDINVIQGLEEDLSRAHKLILQHRLSKYNHSPMLPVSVLRPSDRMRVLVVDQTVGDMSVIFGGARGCTFHAMLQAALAENPLATVYVKTHPEVSSGRKGGYLTGVRDDARIVVLRDSMNPLSLIEQMDHVYVVTSTMGFEALFAGKPVTCFGIPWYSGWGITDDRQSCPRRVRRRRVDELFAAAYFHYARYLNPVTHQRGTIFEVIDWLIQQRRMAFPEEL